MSLYMYVTALFHEWAADGLSYIGVLKNRL